MSLRKLGAVRGGLTHLLLLAALAGPAPAADGPALVLHAVPATGPVLCAPGITGCSEVDVTGGVSTGGIDLFYYVYVMAGGFDVEAGAGEIHFGIYYNTTTVAEVDILTWSLCADAETPGTGWFQEGGSNRVVWETEGCATDSLAVAGYFYLQAYSPGVLALTGPAEGMSATFTPCNGTPQDLPPAALGIIGFGNSDGCNPCFEECHFTPVAATTWSGIKALHREVE